MHPDQAICLSPPAGSDRRLTRLKCGMVFLVALSWSTPLRAAEPTEADRDFFLTVRARIALSADPRLANLNLGVRVKNRVVVLWGPVPSAEVAQRAVQILSNMIDFIEVRNELQLMPEEEPRQRPVRPQFYPDTMPPPPVSGPAYWAKVPEKQHKTEKNLSNTAPRQIGRPDDTRPVLKIPAATTVTTPASGEDRVRKPLLKTAPETAVSPAALQQAVLNLQRSNDRFHPLHVHVRASTVILSAPAFYTDNLHEFSRLLSRVSGIERVVVNVTQ
jgi:hypothetical protein